MNIRDKDLNLLSIFRVVWEERNVSRAAKRIGLSQPAVSNALNRLRANLGNPLFVRVPRGVTPTPFAEALAPRLLRALADLEELFTAPEELDPATLEERLVIAGSDYYGQFVLPELISWLAVHAPGVTVVARSLQGRFPQRELQRGEIDVAIGGFFRDLPDGFYRQKLFSEDFVVLVRNDHPVLQREWSIEEYCSLTHVLISPQGDLEGLVDTVLAERGMERRVMAGIDNFFTPGWVVAGSDLVLTAPRHLADHYSAYLPMTKLPVPFELDGFTVVQCWHQRTHLDPVRKWFRQRIYSAAVSPG